MSMSARIIRDAGNPPAFTPIEFPEHNAGPASGTSHIRRTTPRISDRQTSTDKGGLVASARAQAEIIIAEANEQADNIEKKAYEQGYRAGQETAIAANEERLRQIKAEYQNSILQLSQLREEISTHCEQDLIKLVYEIAKRVVHREVSIDREIVVTMIRVALQRISSDTVATVHVHQDDFNAIESRRHEFLSGDNGIINVVSDRSISRGGCLIETKFGQVDARIEEQFKEIERAFSGLV